MGSMIISLWILWDSLVIYWMSWDSRGILQDLWHLAASPKLIAAEVIIINKPRPHHRTTWAGQRVKSDCGNRDVSLRSNPLRNLHIDSDYFTEGRNWRQ